MEQTFGSFVREHRMSRGLSLRNLAAKLALASPFIREHLPQSLITYFCER